jgi:hypothetical protein
MRKTIMTVREGAEVTKAAGREVLLLQVIKEGTTD